MLKKISIGMMTLLVSFLSTSLCSAQAPPPLPTPETRKPIVMQWKSLEGVHYYYLGKNVDDFDSLGKIIYPLHDYEASRLLTDSKNSNDSGTLFTVGGLAVVLGGEVLFWTDPNSRTNSNNIDAQQGTGFVLSLGGLACALVGAFQLGDSQADQFNAVQRYNAVVHGDDQAGWNNRQPKIQAELLTLKF